MAEAKLKSRYEIKEALGQGAMGVVYFVMLLLLGATLESLIRSSSQRLTVERVVDIGRVCSQDP